MTESYYEMFSYKYSRCKSKKEYKKLCKEMLNQLRVIDGVDQQQQRLLSTVLGEDAYANMFATAIKLYMLEQQGIHCDILGVEDRFEVEE